MTTGRGGGLQGRRPHPGGLPGEPGRFRASLVQHCHGLPSPPQQMTPLLSALSLAQRPWGYRRFREALKALPEHMSPSVLTYAPDLINTAPHC